MIEVQKKHSRTSDLAKFKRQHILTAARRLFNANGLDGLSMRDIAKEAGYSLGAAYSYFRTKEEIQVELLAGILGELTRQIKAALTRTEGQDDATRHAFTIFADYFREHPEERYLLLCTLTDLKASGTDIPAEVRKELDSRLLTLMGLLAHNLYHHTPASPAHAQEETTDFVVYLLGLLILENSGRLQLLNQSGQEMVDRYGERMLLRMTQQKEKE